ncbi:MAG: hypothetical protein AAFY57_04305 [Cyanobacteria bacterium J06642_2]
MAMARSAAIVFGGAAWTRATRRANGGFRAWMNSWPALNSAWFPEDTMPFCPHLAEQWMRQLGLWRSRPLRLVGFSAGCVAMQAIAAELGSDCVKAIVAVDGWCVPLDSMAAPVYRLSHDLITHENGLAWGGGCAQFYADPAVSHLYLWGNPERVRGWQLSDLGRKRTTAANFLFDVLLQR